MPVRIVLVVVLLRWGNLWVGPFPRQDEAGR